MYHSYKEVTIVNEGLKQFSAGVCSDHTTAFEHGGGIFIVPYLLRHGASVFTVSSEGLPTLVASYNEPGDTCTEDISDPDPYGIPSQIEY